MDRQTEAARDALNAHFAEPKDISITPHNESTKFKFSMIRYETLPKALEAALKTMKKEKTIQLQLDGKIKYEKVEPYEAADHQYPHGNMPNGFDVTITVPNDQLEHFTDACVKAKKQSVATKREPLSL